MNKGHKRIWGLDLARGLAMAGVFTTHIAPDSLNDDKTNWWLEIFHGRSMCLFLVVTGILLGLSRMSGKNIDKTKLDGSARRTLIRAFLLYTLGMLMILTRLPWTVILPYYGMSLILIIPFMNLRFRPLLAISLFGLTIWPVIIFFVRQYIDRYEIPETPIPNILDLLFIGYYPAYALIPPILFGLALATGGLNMKFLLRRMAPLALLLAVAGYGTSYYLLHVRNMERGLRRAYSRSEWRVSEEEISGPLTLEQFLHNEDGVVPPERLIWMTVASPHSGTSFDLMGTTGVASLVLILCLGVMRLGTVARWIAWPLTAMGALPLTVYVAHFYVAEWSGFVPQNPRGLWPLFAMLAGFMIFSMIWLKFFEMGPLEMLVQRAAYAGAKRLKRKPH